MEDCYDDHKRQFKCDSCAFAKKDTLTCANPNIWERPAKNSYFIAKGSNLSEKEIESIEKRL